MYIHGPVRRRHAPPKNGKWPYLQSSDRLDCKYAAFWHLALHNCRISSLRALCGAINKTLYLYIYMFYVSLPICFFLHSDRASSSHFLYLYLYLTFLHLTLPYLIPSALFVYIGGGGGAHGGGGGGTPGGGGRARSS